MTIKASVDVNGIAVQIEAMEQRMRDALRPAAFAGAKVYHAEVMLRVPRRTGLLASTVYMAHSADNSADGVKETYHISWNKKKAPHGHFVEYGTSRAPAHPFLRPAYEAAKTRAHEAVMQTLRESMAEGNDGS